LIPSNFLSVILGNLADIGSIIKTDGGNLIKEKLTSINDVKN
jgi:hypothetical protein